MGVICQSRTDVEYAVMPPDMIFVCVAQWLRGDGIKSHYNVGNCQDLPHTPFADSLEIIGKPNNTTATWLGIMSNRDRVG